MEYYQSCHRRLGPQQMNYHLSISLKNKYLYCEVAKAGCSAIKNELWRQEVSDVPLPIDFLRNQSPHSHFPHHILIKPFQLGISHFNELIRDPSFVKWAVVRNPFARALSGYLDKVCRGMPPFENIRGKVALLRDVEPERIVHSEVTFEEFCCALELFDEPRQFDQHWRPQYQHICGDIIPYTFIGKLETLDSDSAKLERLLGFSGLSFSGGSSHATGSTDAIGKYYNERCHQIIKKIYGEDFSAFDYSEDLPQG